MGHANVKDISEAFIRRLYAKGKTSIAEVADVCVEKGIALHAGEGDYEGEDGRYMICYGLEECVAHLLRPHMPRPRDRATPVLEPVDLTPEQTEIYNVWVINSDEISDWDIGDNGCGGEYGILDSIQWRFAPGWRKRYPHIPILEYHTN